MVRAQEGLEDSMWIATAICGIIWMVAGLASITTEPIAGGIFFINGHLAWLISIQLRNRKESGLDD